MHDVDLRFGTDHVTQRSPIANEVTIDEDRHVLAKAARFVEDVSPKPGNRGEDDVENFAHGIASGVRWRASDVSLQVFREYDACHSAIVRIGWA